MVCFHDCYTLGDKHGMEMRSFRSWEHVEQHIRTRLHGVLTHPLFLYDHSGISIKIGTWTGLLPQGHAELDTMCVGFIYTTKDRIRKWYKKRKCTPELEDKAYEMLEAEVEVYDKYLRGEFCGFKVYEVYDEDGDEHFHSCWGFESMEAALEVAKEYVDVCVHEDKLARIEVEEEVRANVG
jgi:hypothetical protein